MPQYELLLTDEQALLRVRKEKLVIIFREM
jgi:hypothetical protein